MKSLRETFTSATLLDLGQDISRMMEEMGYEAPHIGEPLKTAMPKLHTFVKAMYERSKTTEHR